MDHAAWLLAAGRLQSSMVRATAHVPGADECRESSTAGWLLRHPLAATPPVDADEVLARQLTRPDYYSGQNRLLRFFLDAPKAVRKARLAHLARMTEAGPKRQTPKQLAKVLGNPRGQMDLLGLAPNDRD